MPIINSQQKLLKSNFQLIFLPLRKILKKLSIGDFKF